MAARVAGDTVMAVYDAYDGSQLQADTNRAVEMGAVAVGQAVEVALITAVEVASLPPQVLQPDDAEGEETQLSAEASQEEAEAEDGVVEAAACPMFICQYFPDPIPENWCAPPSPYLHMRTSPSCVKRPSDIMTGCASPLRRWFVRRIHDTVCEASCS